MKTRKILAFFIATLILIFCNGCKDRLELEEQAYVSAIGIDKGKNENLSITFQITNVRYGNGGQNAAGTNEKKNETVTFESPDLVAAVNLANTNVARRISLAHARILIVGEEYARSPQFFHQIESALREKEYRRGMNLIISREKASEFLMENSPNLEARTSKYFDFMYDRWQDTGIAPASDLNKFMQRTEDDSSLYLAGYITAKKYQPKEAGYEANYFPGQVDIEGGNPTQMIGAAVFKKGKMIGAITGEENEINVLLRPALDVRSMFFTFEDPIEKKYRISARILNLRKNKWKMDLKGEYPKIDVMAPVEVDILQIPSFIKYVEDPEKQKILKEAIKKQFEEKANRLVNKTQQEFKGEPFLWGERVIRSKFLTYQEYKDYRWMEKYPKAQVTVHFNVKIRGFGKQMNPTENLEEEKNEK